MHKVYILGKPFHLLQLSNCGTNRNIERLQTQEFHNKCLHVIQRKPLKNLKPF